MNYREEERRIVPGEGERRKTAAGVADPPLGADHSLQRPVISVPLA